MEIRSFYFDYRMYHYQYHCQFAIVPLVCDAMHTSHAPNLLLKICRRNELFRDGLASLAAAVHCREIWKWAATWSYQTIGISISITDYERSTRLNSRCTQLTEMLVLTLNLNLNILISNLRDLTSVLIDWWMLPYWYYFKFSGGKSIYRAIDTSLIMIKSTSDLTVKNKPRKP